ncbi:major capsid protein [Sphingobium sp. LMA1-1-1.1]|uniref:major capsid protein n=1 Tax=Sphingobium sp. LMA1-1-1.1 TaxID=3135238 RepID=UPI003428BBA1
MPDALYGTEELLPMIDSLFIPGNFLMKIAFPGLLEFDTEQVSMDRVLDDLRLAPLVSPYSPGKVQQPRGFQKESIVPAYVKPRNPVPASQVMKRIAGEKPWGELSAAERHELIIFDLLNGHRRKIDRRVEWMAASVLKTGTLVLSSADYPATTVDYQRSAGLTKTLLTSDRWGETGISPYDDVDEWINEVGEESGGAVNIVVMDRKAWGLYIADPKAQKALDKTLGQTSVAYELGLTVQLPGSPVFKGRDGNIEFYVYNDKFENDSGSIEALLPDYTVILVSQGGIEGVTAFGLIQDARNQYGKGAYFSKNWIDDNTGAELLESASAPIPVPKRINATLCATVR